MKFMIFLPSKCASPHLWMVFILSEEKLQNSYSFSYDSSWLVKYICATGNLRADMRSKLSQIMVKGRFSIPIRSVCYKCIRYAVCLFHIICFLFHIFVDIVKRGTWKLQRLYLYTRHVVMIIQAPIEFSYYDLKLQLCLFSP